MYVTESLNQLVIFETSLQRMKELPLKLHQEAPILFHQTEFTCCHKCQGRRLVLDGQNRRMIIVWFR